MARNPRVKINISLQGPLLTRVNEIRDTFAFMDHADALRYLIRRGIEHTASQLVSVQTVKRMGPMMEEQFSLALKDSSRGMQNGPEPGT